MMCIYPLDSVHIMHANAALSGCGSLTTSWVGCCMACNQERLSAIAEIT